MSVRVGSGEETHSVQLASVRASNITQAKMDYKGTYPFILLLALMSFKFAYAQSQSCPTVAINDLGSTTEFSTEGLVARGIIPSGQSFSTVPVRIRCFTIVCDTAGDRINTSSYVSVVVEFQCNSQSAISSLTVCNDLNTIVTRQYQFQCIKQNGQPVWATIVSGSNLFVQTLNPTANLSTPLADQCRRCIDDRQSSRADPTTHCDPCPAQCNQGQGRCFLGQTEDMCCNFYLQNNCIDECPSGLVNDSNSVCVCPPLSLGNGTVSYSTEMGVERNIGSVATHTCISGYRLLMQDGGNTRTCNISGWSGQDFICDDDPTMTITDTGMGEGSDDDPTTVTLSTATDTSMGGGSDNGSTVQIVLAATVISVFVLVVMLVILALLVYIIKRKKNQSPHIDEFKMRNSIKINVEEQGASDRILNDSEAIEHQNSRATDSTTLIYADIGPNAVNRVRKVIVPDHSKYKVQYAAINYNAKAPQNLCVPIASMTKVIEDELKSVDLDSLLIVLKEELTPKWYEFGLVVGVPQELMDSYSGYPSNQCLTEVLDYWLRHHAGTMKWAEVADALKAVELNQLAEKAQLLSSSAQEFNDGNDDDYRAGAKLDVTEEDVCTADVSTPKLPPKPQSQVE